MEQNKVRKLLTLDDLCDYYANHKNMVTYNADKNQGTPVVVQLEGTLTFSDDDYDPELSLLKTHLKSCHIGTNRNHSNIEQDVMEEAKASIYNRPILGFIHKLSDGSYDFAGHEMFINEEGELEYEEIPVGCIPESGDAHLVYDKENDKTYLEVDGIIFEEYTRAAQILKSKKESKVSVEIALLDYSYNPKNKELVINKFYFSGITILGVTRDGKETPIEEGMYGSKITLKDFKQNNSMFANQTEETNQKLIETLEKLNNTLANFNINDSQESNENCGKEEENVEDQILVNEEVTEESAVESTEETKVEEEVTEVESTEEVTETETENESEETVDESTPEVVETEGCKKKKCSENEEDEESNEVTETEGCKKKKCEEDSEEDGEVTETEGYKKKKCDEETFELIEKTFEIDGRKFSVSFTLSHEDIRYGLYGLISQYEELDNDWYDIRAVYDDYFVFQGWFTNKIYGCKYTKDGDTVALEGERYTLHEELLTDSEYAQLNDMRANYSSITEKLADYELAEELADKATVFEDNAYANYLDTDEFKSLMREETMKQFSKKELEEKANAALGKLVKATKTFSFKEQKVEKKPSFVSFAATTSKEEGSNAFLDGLRDIGRNKK